MNGEPSKEELLEVLKQAKSKPPFAAATANLQGMLPRFMDPFAQMAQEYYRIKGRPLTINDAWRSRSTQAEAHRQKPGLAAPAGHSLHEQGLAMDIDEAQANELATLGLLQKYGFYRPMMTHAPGHKYEPWHIQLANLEQQAATRGATLTPELTQQQLLDILRKQKKPAAPVFTGKIEKQPLSPVFEGKITKEPENKLEAAQEIISTIPEAFYGPTPGVRTAKVVKEVGRLAQMNLPHLSRPFWETQAGVAEILEDVSTWPWRKLGYTGETSRILSSFPRKMAKMASPEWAQPKTRMEEIATIPGRTAGEIASYLGPGAGSKLLTKALPATLGTKYLQNLTTFLGTDIAKGYAREGVEGIKKALGSSPTVAGLFTVAGAVPGGNAVKAIASGSAFAGAAAFEGERRPDRLAESFLTGAGLHYIMLGKEPSYNADKLFDYLKRGAQESRLGRELERMKFDLRRSFAADSFGPEAKKTGMLWVDKVNEAFADYFRRSKAMNMYRKEFSKLDEDTRWKVSSMAERGEEIPPEYRQFKPYFDARREMFDDTWNTITGELKQDVDYRENYAAHLYKDPLKARKILLQSMGKTPLAGSQRWRRERRIPDMETARSLGLEPLFDNPVDQDLAGYLEQRKYITFQRMKGVYKKEGLIKYFDNGSKFIPSEWAPLDDKSFETKTGRYWAPNEVAAVINNHFSPGGRNLWYNKYHTLTAAWNAYHVALSLYHGMTSAVHSYAFALGDVPDALGRLLSGEIKQPLKTLARVPTAPINHFLAGRSRKKAFYNAGKDPDIDIVTNAMIKGGYRPEHIHPMAQATASSLTDFFRDLGGLKFGKTFRTAIRAISNPLMSHWVPNIKWGVMSLKMQDKFNDIMKQYEGKTLTRDQQDQVMRELQEMAYDERKNVENVFGELSMDQQHMSEGLKKGLKAFIAYPGWNKGTLGVAWNGLVRGPYQVGRQFVEVARGETPTPIDHQAKRGMQFALGLMLSNAIVNSIMQKVLIDEWPKDWEDALIGARTGKFHSNGAPIRASVASYAKDAIGAAINFPVGAVQTVSHKLMFPFQMFHELVTNRDWRNVQIATPRKPWQWPGEYAGWMGKKLQPFSFSQAQNVKVPWMQYGTFVGATQRSRAASNTQMQQAMDDWFSRKRGAMTKEEAATADKKRELRDLYRSGDMEKFESSLQEAISQKLMKASQEKNLRKELEEPELPATFKKITDMREAIEIFKLGSDEEKRQVADIMWGKIMRAKSETKEELEDQIDETIAELDRVEATPSKEELLNILKQGR